MSSVLCSRYMQIRGLQNHAYLAQCALIWMCSIAFRSPIVPFDGAGRVRTLEWTEVRWQNYCYHLLNDDEFISHELTWN